MASEPTTAANQEILRKLQALPSYSPALANLFADLTLEPGDIVTVQSGEESYSLPVFNTDMTWNGKTMTEIHTTGSEKRPAVSATKRNRYASGHRAAQQEQQLILNRADIEKSNTRLLLWASTAEWDALAQQYEATQASALSITSGGISAVAAGSGVILDVYGRPVLDQDGNPTFDPNNPNNLYSKLNVEKDRITAEVQARENAVTSLQSSLVLKADSATLSTVMDSNGQVTAASIATAINDQGSQAAINADRIVLSSSGGSTVTLSDKTTVLGLMQVQNGALYVDGSIHAVSGTTPTQIFGKHVISGDNTLQIAGATSGSIDVNAATMRNVIKDIQLTDNGDNTYTLSWTNLNGDTVTGNFSKAAGVTVDSITAPILGAGDTATSITATATASNGNTKTANLALTSGSFTPTGASGTNRCVDLRLDGNLVGRVNVQPVYNAGANSVTVDSITAPILSASATATSVTATATASNSETGTANLALTIGSYTPSGASETSKCVNLLLGGNTVGRIDINSIAGGYKGITKGAWVPVENSSGKPVTGRLTFSASTTSTTTEETISLSFAAAAVETDTASAFAVKCRLLDNGVDTGIYNRITANNILLLDGTRNGYRTASYNSSKQLEVDSTIIFNGGFTTNTRSPTITVSKAHAYDPVWGDARAKVSWPTLGSTDSSFNVSVPSDTVGGTQTKTFTFSQSGSTMRMLMDGDVVASTSVGGTSHNVSIDAGDLTTINPGYSSLFTAHSTDRGYRTITVKCGSSTKNFQILFTA